MSHSFFLLIIFQYEIKLDISLQKFKLTANKN